MPDRGSPQVKLAELREYVSQSGNTYFSGFMGRTRLVLFKDQEAECTGREVGRWNLLIEEAPPRDGQAASGASGARALSGFPTRPDTDHRAPRGRSGRSTSRRASESRAAAMLRERGIDPATPMIDEIGY